MKFLNLKFSDYKSGFVFVEILVAVALISIVFITLLGIVFSSVSLSASIRTKSRADSLIKEEMEAVRSFRDGTTWANFKNVIFGEANNYYFSLQSGQWVRNQGAETIEEFTRFVVFDQAYRDANGNIDPNGNIVSIDVDGNIVNSGTLDNDTIKVTTTVSWNNQTLQIVTYLTNWRDK